MTVAGGIALVYVEAENGIPYGASIFKAWEGFRRRGYKTALFEPAELHEGRLPIAPDTLLVSGIRCWTAAFRQLGLPRPVADDLPECLASYRGRRVWPSSLGRLRATYGRDGPGPPPQFVKPRRASKLFPGFILAEAEGLRSVEHLPDDTDVLVSECVAFTSEWRCFVCRGRVLGLSHYDGDCLVYPDAEVVRRAIRDFHAAAPAAYGIDFGVTPDGRTLLVEVNDAYALGCFGLKEVPYSEMLEARWLELVAGRIAPAPPSAGD